MLACSFLAYFSILFSVSVRLVDGALRGAEDVINRINTHAQHLNSMLRLASFAYGYKPKPGATAACRVVAEILLGIRDERQKH